MPDPAAVADATSNATSNARPDASPEAGLEVASETRDIEPDSVVRAYLAGVDRTLLAKNLTLTPEERLRQLMALQQVAAELRRAGREARDR